jgi:MFS family permease
MTESLNIPLVSFLIIAIGAVGCVTAGYFTINLGDRKVARRALYVSGICCLASPFAFYLESQLLFIFFLLFWGLFVIADSPIFSTMVAKSAPSEFKGTALTISNSIGFLITIISIELISWLWTVTDSLIPLIALSIGPILGLIASKRHST